MIKKYPQKEQKGVGYGLNQMQADPGQHDNLAEWERTAHQAPTTDSEEFSFNFSSQHHVPYMATSAFTNLLDLIVPLGKQVTHVHTAKEKESPWPTWPWCLAPLQTDKINNKHRWYRVIWKTKPI